TRASEPPPRAAPSAAEPASPVTEAASAPPTRSAAATPATRPAPATTPMPTSANARPVPPTTSAPPVTTAVDAPPAAPSMAAAVVPAAARPPATPPAVPPPTNRAAVDDDQLIRSALQRYRSAYDDLDARSAQAVWPAVNRAALARAFDGLASQSLTFDRCDVEGRDVAASVTSQGSTRYMAKIGSHEPRIEPRVWTFTLRKSGADWQIENARTAR